MYVQQSLIRMYMHSKPRLCIYTKETSLYIQEGCICVYKRDMYVHKNVCKRDLYAYKKRPEYYGDSGAAA